MDEKTKMTFKTNEDDLINDAKDQRPPAVFVNRFVTALGEAAQSETVILRLHHKDWKHPTEVVPHNQVHQFAMNAPRATELAHQLLAVVAQIEKEKGVQSH